ncbi:amyloid protein-binding protein 2-like [Watersipora subatra]|uniref:amyloid protein-binding protein 2-like n=1 Tax=Watersipora subatra TaxID=2589382 RepID=UPI00355BCC3F
MQSLYDLAVDIAARHLQSVCQDYKILPAHQQVDVLMKVKEIGYITSLSVEFQKIRVMELFLKNSRLKLHGIFQCLMDQADCSIAVFYTQGIATMTAQVLGKSCNAVKGTLQFAIEFGDFLAEAGWYMDAERVYTLALRIIQRNSDEESIIAALNCCTKILHVQNGYCCYSEATAMVECTMDMVTELSEKARDEYNMASIYVEMAMLHFAKSHYTWAFQYSLLALKELDQPNVPIDTAIDVLRLCSKGFVVKRNLKLAGRIIKKAMKLAHVHYRCNHPKYADAMMDYGFYLLNLDHVSSAVSVYKKALQIRQHIFGGANLHVALSHEDLAYAHYVEEYNNGDFDTARRHSYQAMKIFVSILPSDHLLLASSKRVRALILEEMAIDTTNMNEAKKLLTEALNLHKESLALAKLVFGDHNVQTAKHYGNLGRLYQTLRHWEQAEEMHKKAIETKEAILGAEDYEVALSIGHLASLYNYDMKKLPEAEELYKRSIDITIKLFGKGYSGLQYDYRGLISLYEATSQLSKVLHYSKELNEWHEIRTRESTVQDTSDPLKFLTINSAEECGSKNSICDLLGHCEQLYPMTLGRDCLVKGAAHSMEVLRSLRGESSQPP